MKGTGDIDARGGSCTTVLSFSNCNVICYQSVGNPSSTGCLPRPFFSFCAASRNAWAYSRPMGRGRVRSERPIFLRRLFGGVAAGVGTPIHIYRARHQTCPTGQNPWVGGEVGRAAVLCLQECRTFGWCVFEGCRILPLAPLAETEGRTVLWAPTYGWPMLRLRFLGGTSGCRVLLFLCLDSASP